MCFSTHAKTTGLLMVFVADWRAFDLGIASGSSAAASPRPRCHFAHVSFLSISGDLPAPSCRQ